MAKDPQVELHKQWLGFLQPQGLVVAPAALIDCHALLNVNVLGEQNRLREMLIEAPVSETERRRVVPSLRTLCTDLLGWRADDLVAGDAAGVEVALPAHHETLRPDFAVRNAGASSDAQQTWLLLIRVLPHGTDFDAAAELEDERHWHASHQARFERLLKESEIPIGVLFNGTHVRLTYAPKGESSGSLTFPLESLAEVAGRPMLAGLLLLLDHNRIFLASQSQALLTFLWVDRAGS